MKKLTFLLLTLLTLSSCSKILVRVVLGVRDSKPETTKSITRSAKRYGYDSSQNFYFIDSSKVIETNDGLFPKAFIYNDKGEVVFFLDCMGSNLESLKYFCENQEKAVPLPNHQLHLVGKDTLKHVAPDFFGTFENIHSFDGSKPVVPDTKFHLVYYWSKSYGRINRKYAASMEKYLKQNPQYSVSFIKINCDFQEKWGYTKKRLKKMYN